MAGWMTALKLVPWGEVIAATPQIVQGAKKLLGKTRRGAQPGDGAPLAPQAAAVPADAPVAAQLQRLGERVSQLEQEQHDSAVLIASLAEQNAQLVRAVDALRLRQRRLSMALAVLGIVCAGLLVWALRQ